MNALGDAYDLVVIGAGIGGLACAAVATEAGLKVMVLERHSKLGGYAQYFGKDPTFDATTWYFPGCAPGGPVDATLGTLGLWERVERLPLDPCFRLRFPDTDLLVPPTGEGFLAALAGAFPDEGDALRAASAVFGEIGRAVIAGERTALPLVQHARHSAHEVFAGCGVSARAEAVAGALWPFLGLPPGRVDALAFGLQWHLAFLAGGVHAMRGGARAFSNALAGLIGERGGRVETRAPVARILVEDGRAAGVLLADGNRVRAAAVVSNADPHETFRALLEQEDVDEATEALLDDWQPSLSGVILHLALPGRLGALAPVTLLHEGYDPEAEYAGAFAAEPSFQAVAVGVPTLADPARAEGRTLVMAMAPVPYERPDDWQAPRELRRSNAYRVLPPYLALKEELGSRLARRAAEALGVVLPEPLLRKVATPVTLERYTLSDCGAAFGWANSPEQSLLARPGPATCLPGLYQCGQWTYPGTGIAAAVLSGKWAAEAVVGALRH